MLKPNPATGDCKRCPTPLCTCKCKRRKQTSDMRRSPIVGSWGAQTVSHRQQQREQWAFKPCEGDLAGKRATPAERNALRRRSRQECTHDGEPDKFPK